MSRRLYHAKHNEVVCDSLCNKTSNVDWVITTAFYAALHYVEHKIFPIKFRNSAGNKIRLKDFSTYYAFYYPYGTPNTPGKHTLRSTLVTQNIPTVGGDYKWLKDTCYNARYVEYQFLKEREYIDEAKRRLLSIKAACV